MIKVTIEGPEYPEPLTLLFSELSIEQSCPPGGSYVGEYGEITREVGRTTYTKLEGVHHKSTENMRLLAAKGRLNRALSALRDAHTNTDMLGVVDELNEARAALEASTPDEIVPSVELAQDVANLHDRIAELENDKHERDTLALEQSEHR